MTPAEDDEDPARLKINRRELIGESRILADSAEKPVGIRCARREEHGCRQIVPDRATTTRRGPIRINRERHWFDVDEALTGEGPTEGQG